MNRFGKNVLVTSSTTLFSRLLGFARDAAMAWILGAGPVADALSVALRLPWAARRLLGEGSLSLGLSVSCSAHENPCRLALAVGRKLFRPAIVILGVLLVFAPEVVDLLAPGASTDLRETAASLLRLTLPYLFFASGAACCMAGMHAGGRFALAGLMPALFNVLVLTFAAVAALCAKEEVFSATLLAAGVLCGGLVQWLILLLAARRCCYTDAQQENIVVRETIQRFPPDDFCSSDVLSQDTVVRETMRRLPAGIFGAAVPQLCFVLAGVFASWQGDMAALFYAERLLEFPLGVLGAAVGMAAVPELRTNTEAVTARVLEWTLALHVAAGAGLAAVSVPLVALLYGHGAFDAQDVASTASCLQVYALALPAYAASRPLLAACQVRGFSGVVNAAAIAGLFACILTGSFVLLLSLSTTGPAFSVVVGLSAQAVWLWAALYRRCGLRLPVLRTVLNIPAAFAVYLSATSVLNAVHGVLGLGLAIVTGAFVWLLLLVCLIFFHSKKNHKTLFITKKPITPQ